MAGLRLWQLIWKRFKSTEKGGAMTPSRMFPDRSQETRAVPWEDAVVQHHVVKDHLVIHNSYGIPIHLNGVGPQGYDFPPREEDEPSLFSRQAAKKFIRARQNPENWHMVRVAADLAYHVRPPKHELGSIPDEDEFEKQEEGGFMSETSIIPSNVQLVRVQFRHPVEGQSSGTFRVLESLGELKDNDAVLVQVGQGDIAMGLVISTLSKTERTNVGPVRYVFQKIDTETNDKLVTQRIRLMQVKQELQQLAIKVKRRQLLEDILKDTPEAADLLKEMSELESL